MPNFVLRNFKGLRQDVDYPELQPDYCHRLSNIDVDDPVGKMRLRDGYSKKFTDTFTDIRSAFEYYFNASSTTKLIFNDNGTLKTYTNGAGLTSLTLPTGSTMANFQNQYIGHRDHVIITTGNGSTNHMLWFGYVDRATADNEGIFGNDSGKQDYILVRQQLITPNGTFSDIYNCVYLDGFYYVTFQNSKWVEKRDSDFHFIERIALSSTLMTDNLQVAIVADTTNSLLYAAHGRHLFIVNPVGWNVTSYSNVFGVGQTATCIDYGTDATYLYVGTNTTLYKVITATGVVDASDAVGVAADDLLCDRRYGYVFLLNSSGGVVLEKRTEAAIATVGDTSTVTISGGGKIILDTDNNYILISRWTTADEVVVLDEDDITTAAVATYTDIVSPYTFVLVDGDTIRCISDAFGTIEQIESTALYYPGLAGLKEVSQSAGGAMPSGTYFYKFSIVDTDGQEYPLSDYIVFKNTLGSRIHNLRLIFNITDINQAYRISGFNIYRAEDTSDTDQEIPSTNYRFLRFVDINSSGWTKSTAIGIYYFDFIDNTVAANISDVTYEENSGLSENLLPRYVNAKFIVFLNEQLHVANFYHDGTTYANEIIVTPVGQPDNVAYYETYHFDFNAGEPINGISTAFGRSVVFNSKKIGLFYNFALEREFNQGLSGVGGFCKKDDYIYFTSDKGLRLFDGNSVHDLSKPVRTYFDAISSYSNPAVFYFDNKDRVIFSFRADSSLVMNIGYGEPIWTQYGSTFAFRGYFKNYANEYIAWDGTKFYELFDGSTKDAEDVGGGNGSNIAIDYESPLLHFSDLDGEIVELYSMRHRMYESGTLSFKLYRFETDSGGKTLLETYTIVPPASTEPAVKTHFFNGRWGDSFSFQLTGTIAAFKFHSITFEYGQAGFTNDV